MFAFTSVLYARARSFSSGRAQRRTVYAADFAFRAVVYYLFALALISVTYFLLVDAGYRPDPRSLDWPTKQAPLLASFPSLILITVAYLNFFYALRMICWRFLLSSRAREIVRYVRGDA